VNVGRRRWICDILFTGRFGKSQPQVTQFSIACRNSEDSGTWIRVGRVLCSFSTKSFLPLLTFVLHHAPLCNTFLMKRVGLFHSATLAFLAFVFPLVQAAQQGATWSVPPVEIFI